MTVLEGKFKSLGLACNTASVATKALTGAIGLLAGVAIVHTAKAISKLHVTIEEAKEALSESVNKFNDTTQEVKELESQLETCTSRLEELQKLADDGTISIADKEELKLLKEQNKELERNIALKKEEQIADAQKVLKNAKTTGNKKVATEYFLPSESSSTKVTSSEELLRSIDAYNEYSKWLNDESNKDLFHYDDLKQGYENGIDDATDRIRDMYDNVSPVIDAYEDLIKTGYALTDTQKDEYEQLKKTQDAYMMHIYNIRGTKEAFRGLNEEQQRGVILNRLLEQGLSDSQAQSVLSYISSDHYNDLWDKDFDFIPPSVTDYKTAEAYGKAYAKAWIRGASSTTEDFELFSKSQMIDAINEMVDGFDVLDEIYADIYDKGSFDFTKLDTTKFADSFKGLEDEYVAFIETISSSPDDINACQEAFDNLVTAYINSNDILANVTEETAELTAAMLSNMGIANANEIVVGVLTTKMNFLSQAKNNAAITTTNLDEATTTEIASLITENDVIDESILKIINYYLAKINVNNNALSTENDIEALSSLVKALGGTTTALKEYAKYKALISEYTDRLSSGFYDSVETQHMINYYTDLMNEAHDAAQAEINAALKGSAYKPVYNGGDKTADVKKSLEESKETFDWVETTLSRIQRTITNLGKVVSATYKKWGTRNNALAQEMSAVNQEIAAQQSAYNTYMDKANSVALPEHYKNLVRNGGMSISDITNDKKLADNIKLYQEYYEKALDAADAVEDLRANLAELAMTNFDHISKQYDDMISLVEHRTSMLEGYISQSEAAGFWASEVYYQKLADTELENINQLQSEYNDLLAKFNENVNNGYIEKYSEAWYEMYQNINDVEQALQDANTALIEYNQTLQQIRWDLFDRGADYKNNLVEESNFLIDMLDNYAMHNEDGSLTDHGLAVQGLRAMNYNIYMEQAASYADEIKKINAEIVNDPNDLTLIDRRNELLDLQQQAIQNAMAEKEAIKDLVSESYDKMLSSLQELIDKRKEALNAEKDLYSYQNSIKEKTDTISNYRKQLQSYAGDNSEEAQATIQKLQLSLKEAEQDLKETEYEKWLSDQESLLDDLYDQTETWINGRLDNIDGLVYQSIEATNANTSIISQTISDTATALGYTLSTSMESIWNSDEGGFNKINNVVKAYGDILYGTQNTINTSISNCTTTVQTALKSIDDDILKMIDILNAEAKAHAESIAQEQEQAESSQEDHDDYEWNPSPAPEPENNKVTLNGGLFYEDSYKGGKTGNSVSQWTGREVEVTHTSSTGMVHIVDAQTGTILGWVDPNQLQGYATGTTNARRGFNMVSEAGDEIVLDNNGNAVLAKGKQLYPFEGGETVINAAETANMLKNNLVPLNEHALLGNMVKKSNYSSLQGLHSSGGNISNDIKMNISLPNVTDYDSFVTKLKSDKRFEKIVQSMTVDQVLNKNSLFKNKL